MDHIGIKPVSLELLDAVSREATEPSPPTSATQTLNASSNNNVYTSRLMVDRWLTDRGRGFRVKQQSDGKGRTVFVLAECPFDPRHTDPDSCIMQDEKGKLSAQCFHNGCQGRGWQDFKKAIGPPEAHHFDPPLRSNRIPKRNSAVRAKLAPPASADHGPITRDAVEESLFPSIQGNKRQLPEVTGEAIRAIVAKNDPPAIFQRGGLLTRVRIRAEDGAPLLQPLDDAALRGVLARAANWTKVRDVGESIVEEDDAPPMEVVKDLASLPNWENIPIIRGVIESPVFARNGELVQSIGYHPMAQLWYQPAAGLQPDSIPDCPTPAEIMLARDLLVVELLGDFPFRDQASRAHAVAAIILPFVRQLIDGPTPLHLLDAPMEGTGKSLLASVISLVSTGRDAEPMSETDKDEEWRKRITAILIDGATVILLDNLTRVLDSAALASALTGRFWKDRLLGHSKTVNVPNLATWLASGNNTRLSREMLRRTLWCRLDAQVDAPWDRKNFRHPNLIVWAKSCRGKLITAVLTICQGWIRAGSPAGSETLGSFESWAQVIGGILQYAGIPGLLTNKADFRAQRTDRASDWRAFVTAWWFKFQDSTVGVEELYLLAADEKLLDGDLGDKGERSQRTRLGLLLGKMVDRVFGRFRVVNAGVDHKQRQRYQLVPVATETHPGDEDGNDETK